MCRLCYQQLKLFLVLWLPSSLSFLWRPFALPFLPFRPSYLTSCRPWPFFQKFCVDVARKSTSFRLSLNGQKFCPGNIFSLGQVRRPSHLLWASVADRLSLKLRPLDLDSDLYLSLISNISRQRMSSNLYDVTVIGTGLAESIVAA